MKRKKIIFTLMMLTMLLALLLTACGGKNNEGEETEDANAAITQVVETAMVALTQTAAANPTATPTATIQPTATSLPTMQPSPTLGVTTPTATLALQQPPGGTGNNVSSCDNAEFVSDVTIPDGTQLTRGEKFTKTWKIKNIGTCTWSAAYQLVFYGGEQMGVGATAAFTTKEVDPGDTIEISLNMTAPSTDGEYYSYWIMRNANGQNFFINGSSIYVQIKVGAAPTAAATKTATTTANTDPTITITAPASGTTGTAGTPVTFSATASDTEDGDLTSSIKWTYTSTSSGSGSMGGGGSINYAFSAADTYTVTAAVTDSGGKKVTATVEVTIN